MGMGMHNKSPGRCTIAAEIWQLHVFPSTSPQNSGARVMALYGTGVLLSPTLWSPAEGESLFFFILNNRGFLMVAPNLDEKIRSTVVASGTV